VTADLFGGDIWYGAVAAAVTGLSVMITRWLDHRASRRRITSEETLGERETLLKEWHSIRDALRAEIELCHQEREDLRDQMDSLQDRMDTLEQGARAVSVQERLTVLERNPDDQPEPREPRPEE
jgi:ubiquinone biosynthesis protein UbiJ